MLDLDQELFQTIVLAGLLLLLLVSLAILAALSGIRKALEEASARASFTDGGYGSAVPRGDSPREDYSAASQPAAQTAQSWQTESTTPAAAATAAQTAGVPVTSQVAPTSSEPMPEEQPFEREGRWWFKRGNEILLYDEQSGQWVPAPEGALGGGSAASQPSVSSAFQSIQTAEPAPASTGERQDSGGFWKCPSCGAVNGSTAATCRMCFTAKP